MVAQPFFCSPGTGERPTRRLLLLSYHFPPGEAVGALRWQKMARIAVERGWNLDVVTLAPSSLPSPNSDALGDLPPGLRLYGVPRPRLHRERLEHALWRLYDQVRPRRKSVAGHARSVAPTPHTAATISATPGSQWRWSSMADWKRAYYAWLEVARDRRWARDAAELARHLAARNRYEALVSCGPPHMVHWAGQRLAVEAGIPFVMDLRDPWSLVERLADSFASPVWFHLARRFEREAVAGASLIVMNTEPARRAMGQAYPRLSDRIMTVMNGYDEDRPGAAPDRSEQFAMVFAGSIYLDRDPRFLLRAAARVVRELRLAPRNFRIEFVGNVGSLDPGDPSSIAAIARAEGLGDHVGVSGFRPRGELAALLAKATMLVSLYQDSRMAIPSKIFDYMQYDAWILAFAEPGSATELVLRGSDADVVGPQDFERLIHVLTHRYRRFSAGERPVRLARDPRLSRRTQAALLFERLESLTAVHSGPGKSDRGSHDDAT